MTTNRESLPTDLLGRRFRAGKGHELVPFDRLEEAQQQALDELQAEADFFGLLRPAGGGSGSWKSVNRDTALLLYTLATPGPLPFFVRRSPEAEVGITQLVLDGVLEVESEARFVSGVEALSLLEASRPDKPGHRLAQLSRQALHLAVAAQPADPAVLADQLYHFHRRPLTPRWSALLAHPEAVLGLAGLAKGSRARLEIDTQWEIRPSTAPGTTQTGWIYFHRRGPRGVPRAAGQPLSYKLYVSPEVEALAEVLPRVLTVATRRGVTQGKLGADAAGLLRPDKLVFYLSDLDRLLAVARELETELAGVAAHGVPFTAPIDPAGLLSWGADPPASERPLAWQGPESWRTWLVGRLAAAIAAAGAVEPQAGAHFALTRLRSDGVDVERWLPTAMLWKAA